MSLKYPPFANNVHIQRAADNSPALKAGESSSAVAILQGALIDLGYPMPVSTRKKNRPDGIYGAETSEVVHRFQTARGLPHKDGIAGRETFSALDALLSGTKPSAPPPVAPPPPALPSTRDYEIGTGDPPIHPDAGAGAWNSVPKSWLRIAEREAILEILPYAMAYPGPHAVAQMLHYLGNSGQRFQVDLEAMVADVPSGKGRFENEVSQARQFVELLPAGTFPIRSKQLEQGYNRKSESADWFFAVGGYSTWGIGQATVRDTPAGQQCELQFEYRFYDRYNWDGGKSVTIAGITITDEAMGEFHREGLAKEYDVNGSFQRRFQWKKGQPIPPQQLLPPGSR